MLPDRTQSTDVVDAVYADLKKYVLINHDHTRQMFETACDELTKAYPEHEGAFQNTQDLLRLSDEFLNTVEALMQDEEKTFIDDYREGRLRKTKRALQECDRMLRRLIPSFLASTPQHMNPVEIEQLARILATRVGDRHSRKCGSITYAPKYEDWLRKKKFVSWLCFKEDRRTHDLRLIIIFDQEKIYGETEHTRKTITERFEKVFLHELGHARQHLGDLLNMAGEGPDGMECATANPIHETEAWSYALTLRGTVASILSRLERLQGKADGTWLYA